MMPTKNMATIEAVPPLVSTAPEQLFRNTLMQDFCEFYRSLDEGEYVPPPNEQSINTAWQLFCRLNIRQILPTRIMPSPEGGVALCFSRRSGRYADLECFNNGKTMGATSDGRGNVEVFKVDLHNEQEVEHVIFRIGQFLDSAQDALPFSAAAYR
jgi:hypothetical protein